MQYDTDLITKAQITVKKGAASIPTNDVKRPRGRAVSAPDFGSWGRWFESRWRRDSSQT